MTASPTYRHDTHVCVEQSHADPKPTSSCIASYLPPRWITVLYLTCNGRARNDASTVQVD